MRFSASTALDWERPDDLSSGQRYSSQVQQPWYIQVDAGGRIGTSDLVKQLVRLRLPVATDQKVRVQSASAGAWRRVTNWVTIAVDSDGHQWTCVD